jgi:hypothetical protein
MSRVPQTLLSLPPEVRDFSTTIVTNVNPAASLTFLVDTGLSRLNYRIEPIDCFSLILIQSLFDLAGDCARGTNLVSPKLWSAHRRARAMVFQGIEGAQRIQLRIKLSDTLGNSMPLGVVQCESQD